MNDLTPDRLKDPRLKGSLLERAASVYDFAPRPLAGEPVIEVDVAPRPKLPVAKLPVFEPEILTAQPRSRVAAAPRGGVATIDRAKLASAGAIVPGGAVTALSEEFRLVKRQILQTARLVAKTDEAKACTVLICSANPNDGKTFCAINLALSLAAEREIEVLLVDADFAKPDVFARFGLEEAPGLLDALGDRNIDPEALVVRTDVPQLSLLSAGTRTNGDTELLSSSHAWGVIQRLVNADPNRIVIFDSPPALAASPGSELAALVGQVMLVVRADRTSEADLRSAVSLLDQCEHIQLVLNSVAFRPGGQRFGSYYSQETAP